MAPWWGVRAGCGGVVVQGREGLSEGAAHVRVTLGVAGEVVELDGGLRRAPAVRLWTEEKSTSVNSVSRYGAAFLKESFFTVLRVNPQLPPLPVY